MAQYGNVIAKYRKSLNLTQKQLADKLYVSPQAVSKWEKNQSQPELATIKTLADLFNITLDQFFEEGKSVEPASNEIIQEHACIVCLKPFDKSSMVDTEDGSMCGACHTELANETQAIEMAQLEKPTATQFKQLSGIIPYYIGWGSGIVLLIVTLLTYTGSSELGLGEHILASVLVALLGMTFITQMFLDTWLRDFLFDFVGRSFRMPGIIFELSIDGVIRLILVKILLSLLAFLISSAVFLFGLALTIAISPITYTIDLITRLRKGFNHDIS